MIKLRNRERVDTALQDRLVWQAASLLLVYPDDRHAERLDTVGRLLEHLRPPAAPLIAETAAALRERDPMGLAAEYVETFDMHKRSTLLLTYWTAGDTRNRGVHMLEFAQTYRDAGVAPPKGEAPDHLPVVLEFAATVDPDGGRRLLTAYRVPIDAVRGALAAAESPYAPALTAVCATLPVVTGDDAQRLACSGPPTETVGLQPFQLTVPPRRHEEAVR